MKVLINLVFIAVVAFLLVPSPAFSEEERLVTERWKSVLIEQKNKVGQLGDMSIEQVKDALEVLDTAQRTTDMELLHQERVLEQLTESFNEIKETYLAKKREFETPPNVFAGGVEFAVTDFDDNIKASTTFRSLKAVISTWHSRSRWPTRARGLYISLRVILSSKTRRVVSSSIPQAERNQICRTWMLSRAIG